MNAYRYIIALLFSLLIIFAGVGVAVIHCYCVNCQTVHVCCEDSHNHKTVDAGHAHAEDCCTAVVYKIDLMKGTEEMPVFVAPAVQLCHVLALLFMPLPNEPLLATSFQYPPPPPEPRGYLALYSVFII